MTNGDMELDGNWVSYNAPYAPEVNERSGVQKHGGSYSRHVVDSTPGWGGIKQTIPKVAGKTYTFSFWYYIVSGGLYAGMTSGDNATWLSLIPYSTTGSWQYAEVIVEETVTGALGGPIFQNGSSTAAAEFYIDDVSVQEVLEFLTNGDMELNGNWVSYNAPYAPEVNERSGVQKHGGSYSRHVVDSTPGWGGIEQTIPKVAGKTYTFSFWYYIVSGGLYAGMISGDNATWLSLIPYSTTGSWQYAEVIVEETVTGALGGPIFQNGSSTAAAEFYIDDVSVQEIDLVTNGSMELDGNWVSYNPLILQK